MNMNKSFVLLALLGMIAVCAAINPYSFYFSGHVDPAISEIYGGPVGMAIDPFEADTVWALYSNLTGVTPGEGSAILVRYNIDPISKRFDFPISQDGGDEYYFGSERNRWSIPGEVVNDSYAFTGLTFDASGNFIISGARPDYEPNTDTPVNGAAWVLNYRLEPFNLDPQRILGPMVMIEPITEDVSGIAYDANADAYWVVDPPSAALYETIVTCCQEQQPDSPDPQSRWLQQIAVRRGVGLQYGLRGDSNIFERRRDTSFASRVSNAAAAVHYGSIAVPGFASPQDVTVDPITGHLWLVNNFPTTTILEVTTDMVVVNHYNIEAVTGGLRDATSIAVTSEYIIVGFRTEAYIAVLLKPAPGSTKKDLVMARRTIVDPAAVSVAAQETKHAKADTPKKTKADKPKSHFH